MSKKPLYSSHIFMFPFRFDWVEKKFDNEFDFYKDKTINERVKDIDSFDGWKLEKFNLKKDLENHKDHMYNEFAYFYDYARDAIYNLNDDSDNISYYFEKECEDAKYQIKLKDKSLYELDITGLSLRIFSTGAGILSIELENRKEEQSSFEDILRINDFGRRIYPQFISDGKSDETKGAFLADKITITGTTQEPLTESFEFKPDNDIVIGNHIMQLLGDSFTQNNNEIKKYYIQPILDDRMFVLSWYGNNDFSKQLVDEKYIENDNWYKYVFVDGKDKTVFSKKMQTKLIKESTYDRWMNYKYGLTLYGVSRYSFVALTNDSDFGKDKIRVDMETMYFQMITLLLATRASILRFSDEIAAVASDFDSDKLTKLYKRYLTFYNRLYFKEITHQDQGIELYDMARKQMNIDEHMEKLDNKFTKLFEFAELQSSNEGNKSMNKLTIMGAIFLPPSLLVALFSMGIYDYDKSYISLAIGLTATFASGYLGWHYINNLLKNKEKKS